MGLAKPSQRSGTEKVHLGSLRWTPDAAVSCRSDLLMTQTALEGREKLWLLASRQQTAAFPDLPALAGG